MKQPTLDHHLVVVHLGGSKRVQRVGEGGRIVADVENGAITVAPCGSFYDWSTQGPIDFVHFYLEPKRFERTILEIFDRDPRSAEMQERLGLNDKFLQTMILTLFEDCRSAEPLPRLYYDGMIDGILLRLVRMTTEACGVAQRVRQAMSPRRLQRVMDFILDHLANDLSLDVLADVAGLSRYHFSHAFRRTTGMSPYQYVIRLRVEHAKAKLSQSTEPLAIVAHVCGFGSIVQFSRSFKKVVGISPSEWRRRS